MQVHSLWLALISVGLAPVAAAQRLAWRLLIVFVVDQPTPFLEESLSAVAELHLSNQTRFELHILPAAKSQLPVARRTLYDRRTRFAQVALFESPSALSFSRLAAACTDFACDFLLYQEALVRLRRPSILAQLCALNLTAVAPFAASQPAGGQPTIATARLVLPAPRSGLHRATRLRHIVLLRSDRLRHASARPVPMETGMVLLTQPPAASVLRRRSFQAGLSWRHNRELWQVFENPVEWEERYLHPGYHAARARNQFETPCPDVYWIPLFSREFCMDMREEMELFGLWSGGHQAEELEEEADPRRTEVKLPYATVDIFMWQINFNKEYMWILQKYLYPIQLQIFPQYDDLPYAIDNFVVRYRMGEQVKLESHFDESKISLNVALSNYGEEYEGGGTHFVRYDCSVVQTRQGWGLLHPNRPTHRHQGLELTNGTRYILVSFLDGQQYITDYGMPSFN